MRDDRITLVTFADGAGATPVERLMAGGRLAAAEDLVDLALACPQVGQVITRDSLMRVLYVIRLLRQNGFARRLCGRAGPA